MTGGTKLAFDEGRQIFLVLGSVNPGREQENQSKREEAEATSLIHVVNTQGKTDTSAGEGFTGRGSRYY